MGRMETRKDSPRGNRAFHRDFQMARRTAPCASVSENMQHAFPGVADCYLLKAFGQRPISVDTPSTQRKDRRSNRDPNCAFLFWSQGRPPAVPMWNSSEK
jgi:hypothetical protein